MTRKDTYVIIERQSWAKRLVLSLTGLVLGPALVLFSFIILRHAEIQRAVNTFGLKGIISEVYPDEKGPDEALFLISDTLRTKLQTLVDRRYGVVAKGLKLHRKSYTYLWVESESETEKEDIYGNLQKTKVYTYTQRWVSDNYDRSRKDSKFNVNSSTFKERIQHENPRIDNQDTIIKHSGGIIIGQYILNDKLYDAMKNYKLWPLQKKDIYSNDFYYEMDTISKTVCPSFDEEFYKGGWISGSGSNGKTRSIFIGEGLPEGPLLGDKRIEYWHIEKEPYTVVGLKNGNVINTLKNDSLFIRSPQPCGGIKHNQGHFGLIFPGKMNVKQVFREAHKENDKTYIILRIIGLLLTVLGFILFGNPLATLFAFLPFVGKIWQFLVFKVMQVLGTVCALSISGYYFLKHSSIFNLTIYDFYFGVGVILFLVFVNVLRVSYSQGYEQV